MFPEEDEDFMARVQRSAQQEVEQADAAHEAPSKDSDTAEQPMEEAAEPGQIPTEGNHTGDGPTFAVAPTGKQTLGDSVESEGGSRTQELEAELQRYYQGPATDMGLLIEVSKRAAG